MSGKSRGDLRVVRTIPGTPLATVYSDVWRPPTDVYETDTDFIVKVDIAGADAENMDVTLSDGLLRVHGIRTDCSAFSKSAVHRMEIYCGAFETHVHLPRAIDVNAEADCIYHNGMLTITIPKEIARKILITSG